ncbi:hypothetical protein SEVIR_6G257600v4 [Setaria viridis]|uniref:RING-type E3 ubiquitin transferase n=1 Tax=Setaria viridis TaxID=4556 RepID=A0A4U6UBL7_SETVI|nr:RING-H2 finger protein ATL1-like [Setaria viridis]TKW11824.1 hypothetical protein SEVIR_6G257600v2 [Setaria viridis]
MESSSVPGSSFVILSVSIVGILSTALLLLAYYLFLTRCGLLFWRADQSISVAVSVTQEPPRRSGGLEEVAIRRIPTFRYGGQQLLPVAKAGTAATECAVCLADFRDGERLRLLPPCLHAFHIDCIDAWLQATANCPLCRAAVVELQPADGIVIDIATTTCPEAEETHSSTNNLLPVRRSLSMDSSTDRRFYLALQRILLLQQGSASQGEAAGKGDTAADSSSRRLRRSFFSFSHSRGESRSAVLPL